MRKFVGISPSGILKTFFFQTIVPVNSLIVRRLTQQELPHQSQNNPHRNSDQQPLRNAGLPVAFVYTIGQIFAGE
jgi:hypothetical protein